jgi:hypothetical protein
MKNRWIAFGNILTTTRRSGNWTAKTRQVLRTQHPFDLPAQERNHGAFDSSRPDCAGTDFAFGQAWNGVVYATKCVWPILVEESDELVVVTAYTSYF